MCTAVVWDPDADGGMGDIAIRNADILNLFWEPGIKDIEESANLFYVTLVDRERLNLMYPELCEDDTESVAGGTENVEKYKRRIRRTTVQRSKSSTGTTRKR